MNSTVNSALAVRRRRAGLVIGGAVALAGVSLTAGVLLGPSVRSPAQAAADAAPPAPSTVTAAVERRVLAEPVILRGTVTPGEAVRVTAPAGLSGPDAVVTAVPARSGRPLREGMVFLEVAGAPVFGLVLPFPLYRDLTAGASGPDVIEVQRALRRLGYDASTGGTFDPRTQAALERFYAARGYSARAGTDGQTLSRNHVVRLDRAGRDISTVPVKVGAVLSKPGAVVLELDAAAATIRAAVAADQRPLVTVGSNAAVTDEVRGVTTTAKVRGVAADVEQGDQSAGFPVTLAFTGKALPPAQEHTVLVTIRADAGSTPVLAVPVTAVFSRPDGATAVTVVGVRTTEVPVRTGKTAGGWVAVTGRLTAGDRVAVGTVIRAKE